MPSIDSNRKTGKAAIESGQLIKAAPAAVDVAPPTPPLTNTNQSNTFMRTPLPASYVQQPDQQRSWQAWGVVPQNRVPPLPPASNAQAGAQAQSQATIVVAQTPPSTGTGGLSSVTLNVPNIFTPVAQTGNPLTIALAAEPSGTVFTVPPPGLSALEAISSNIGRTTGSGAALTLTATPTTATSWGLYAFVGNQTSSLVNPSGWTALTGTPSTGVNGGSYVIAISGTSPIVVSETLPINDTAAAVLALFSGTLPTAVQQVSSQPVSAGTATLAFGGANTAGNTIVVIAAFSGVTSAGPISLSISDTAGNQYTILSTQQGTGVANETVSLVVAIAPNCIGSANSVNVVVGGTGSGGCRLIQVVEFTPFAVGPQTPLFSTLFPSQVPPINVGSVGNGGITGVGKVANGFTGANLSATGGVHQFVSQPSAGAAFVPVQPDFSDLAGATGQKATSYNGIPLVSNGLATIIKTVDLTAQTAAISATTLLAVATTGQYRLSWYAKVTTAAVTSSTLGPLTITFTDADNTAQSITMAAFNSAGTIETSDSVNTTTTVMLGIPVMLNARASTNIQYAFAYASNAAAAMNYNLHIKLEAL